MAHPGEEEGDKENPILKTAGVSQHARPNLTREENLPATDVVPIQARAYSLPIDTGIYQAALRFDKLRNPDRTKEAEEYINAWNEAKKPPEQPMRRVRIRASKKSQVQESTVSFQNSLIDTIKPTRSPRDNSLLAPRTSQPQAQEDPSSVPTRSVTNTAPAPAPMYAAIGASTLSASVSEMLEKTRKEPFGMYNLAGRTWRKMLPELLEIR